MALDEQTTGRILKMEKSCGRRLAISRAFSVTPEGIVKFDYSDLKDLKGNRIGTEENLIGAFRDVIFNVCRQVSKGWTAEIDFYKKIDEYKAIRFCCDMDTDIYDKYINEALDEWSPLFDKSIRV